MSFEIVSSLGRFEQEMLRPHAKIAIAIAFDAFGVMNIGPPSVSRILNASFLQDSSLLQEFIAKLPIYQDWRTMIVRVGQTGTWMRSLVAWSAIRSERHESSRSSYKRC
jgi:hypothetical protein